MQSFAVVYELLNFTFSNLPLHLEQSRVDRSFKNNTARSTFSSLAYGKFKTCVHYSFRHMVAHITNIEVKFTKTVDYHPIKDKKFIVVWSRKVNMIFRTPPQPKSVQLFLDWGQYVNRLDEWRENCAGFEIEVNRWIAWKSALKIGRGLA